MNYGVYVSASGLLTSMYRMDVAANNLANSQTVGFKPDETFTRQRLAARQEDNLGFLPSNAMLERLGGGVHMAPNRVTFRQGGVEASGNPLDVAIVGDAFMVTRDGPNANLPNLRLTRDGRLAINTRRQLVQAESGLPVLDRVNRPITLEAEVPVTIESNGVVRQNNQIVAQIQLVDVSDRQQLRKLGNGLFTGPGEVIARRRPAGDSELRQGFVERSAVDPIKGMLDVMRAERGVSSNTRLVSMHDELMNRAISTFARIA